MVKETLRENWRSFLINSAIDPRIRGIKADTGEDFELLPSTSESWWMPKEWVKGKKNDIIAVNIEGEYDPLDLLVHELAHKKWTSRSLSFRHLLCNWADVLNICEDVRVEYLAVEEWGWVFRSWSYPPIPQKLSPQDAILWGLYVKKVARSRGEDVPQEWRTILPFEEVEKAYEELLKVKDEKEYEEFLKRWFPQPPSSPPPGRLSGDISPFSNIFNERYKASEELAQALAIGGGRETRQEWFDYSVSAPPLPPALMSLLNRLVVEEVERVPTPYGGRYSFRRDLRGRKDCYVLPRRKEKKEVSIIVDTSGSMKYIGKEVRTLLAGLNTLAKRGVIKGKVIFVAGGKALPVSLPTSQPIWAVKFDGGTNGYKEALPYLRDDDIILFVSDLAISPDDVHVVKELQGRAYFLYGGPAYEHLLTEARKQGFTRNLCFAPTIVGALQKALTLLGL